MSKRKYHIPGFLNIFIAGIIFAVLLDLLWTLPDTVKQVGDFFLYIPSRFGFVQRVLPDEIITISSKITSPTLLEITKPGKYLVFADDADLLLDNARADGKSSAILAIKSHTTGESVKVVSVERGIRPYDTPLTEGRPIFAFEITIPGSYEITLLWFYSTSIAIVPDYITDKEPIILLTFVVQTIIILIPFGIFYYLRYQRYQARIKSIQEPQVQRQIKGQAFWESEIQKSHKKTQEK
jgi:hypothetical protein